MQPVRDDPPLLDATKPCTGDYDCECAGCQLERMRRVRQGVRGSRLRGVPISTTPPSNRPQP